MHLLIIGTIGALVLFALGYFVGVKRHMCIIAGYKPGRIKNEEAVAKSFRVYCFGGGALVLAISITSLFL